MKSYKLFIFFVATVATIISCTSGKKAEAVIQPPFNNVNVDFSSFDFDAERGIKTSLPTGTLIEIPGGALVDKNGLPVKGKVSLRYREFLDAAGILMSGIPMVYDTAGGSADFISAGMFEIGVSQNGSDLQIATGKKVRVLMASPSPEDNFNFYSLNKNDGKWNYEGRTHPVENPLRKQILDSMMFGKVKPIEPKKMDISRSFRFDIDMSAFTELKMFNNVQWEYNGSDEDPGSPAQNAWIFSQNWRDISATSVEGTPGVYTIELKGLGKSFSMPVKPVFSADDLSAARERFEIEMKNYNEALQNAEVELRSKNIVGEVLREYELTSFGVCNWDRIQKMIDSNEFKVVTATYSFEEFVSSDQPKIFLITNGGKSVRACVGELYTNMVYDPTLENKLLAVFPDNHIAVFRAKDFRKISDVKSFNFEMDIVQEKITSHQQLQQIIEGI